MGASDHWQYQGRQNHGWFGHGTGPGKAVLAAYSQSVVDASIDERAFGLTHSVIGALPASLRRRIEAQYQHETLPRLKEALAAWIRGARLEPDVFASRFLGRAGEDPVARDLHSAAGLAATATSHADRAEAAYKLADAIKGVGVDGWPRFVADAAERARDPQTQAAIKAISQPPPYAPDAIRPVYPVEEAIGAATGGLISEARTAARMLGGAIVRGVTPASRPAADGAPAEETTSGARPTDLPAPAPEQDRPSVPATSVAPDRPPISRQKQAGHVAGTPQYRNRLKRGKETSTFDGSSQEANALTQEAWGKGTPDPKDSSIRKYDFGRRIGTGQYGGGQSTVRVVQDSKGRIHGHPDGKEAP